jgi:hypothetical protein
MINKQKGFFSIILLLYIMIMLLTTTINNKTIEFGTITLAETQKTSKIYSFEKIIENNLNNNIENPQILKTKVNLEIFNFFKENDLYIYDIINKTKKEITIIDLELMTHVIVLKPAKNVLIKRYYITNGINKNKCFAIAVKNINYHTRFLFPETYYKEVIVYKT